tara:strand:- start:269 stop:889 length:621 start_codon:yes stop_codon:yes gene_type:complete
MRKILFIIILIFFSITSAYALKFEKCYTKEVMDKDSEKLLVEMELFGKFNNQKIENSYYQVFSDGTAERVIIQTDKWNKEEAKRIDEEFKDASWVTPQILAKMKKKIQSFSYKVIFANENYIKLESTSEKKLKGIARSTATLNLKNGEVTSTGINGEINVVKQCEISRKGKSGLLDYWWALILIIAITFFVYTQSATRLKKLKIRK